MAKLTDGLIAAFSDWLSLFDGPKHKVFSDIVKKEDWTRLFKLLMLVLGLSGAVVGAQVTIAAIQHAGAASVLESRLAINFLLVGAILSVAYSFIARLFGIKLSLKTAFFVTLSLLLPWVPIANCIDTIQSLPPFKLIGIIFLLAHLVLIRPIYNFYQGVVIVSHAAKWRAMCSILLPLFLFTFLVVYMFG
jgi:hypothetical protein